MTPRARDGSFTHTHGVMPLFPTGVKKVHCGMAWFLRKPCFYRCSKESNVDPAEVAKNGGLLLANPVQGSSSTFSCVNFPRFFAFQAGMWDTPISALLNSPTVIHEPGLSTGL